jgi:hypothetical protein
VGTEFQLVDAGAKPGSAAAGPSGGSSGSSGAGVGGKEGALAPQRELAAIAYEPNILGTKGPRKMVAALPLAQEHSRGRIASQQVGKPRAGTYHACLRSADT